MSVPRSLGGLLLILAALMLLACGTGADATQARSAAERFARSVRQHDGARACAQLSPDTRSQLVKDDGKPCARAVLGLPLHGARAAKVRVYGTSAQVVLAGGDTLFLGDTKQGWRIEALGCKPQRGGPYDCEAQA